MGAISIVVRQKYVHVGAFNMHAFHFNLRRYKLGMWYMCVTKQEACVSKLLLQQQQALNELTNTG